MSKKLISLEEYNKNKKEKYSNRKKGPHYNGIECPNCGKELVDTAPNLQIMSYPPQTRVHCLNCDYSGTRIV